MKSKFLVIAVAILSACLLITCSSEDTGVESKNHAPALPENLTADGSPANGATDVVINPVLKWSCTDPDGDALKYDVSFGSSGSPSIVSTDQTATSYSPTGLDYSTTYYWNVEAHDPSGASATSPTFLFTTEDPPAETISIPTVPSGPAMGEEGASLTYSTGGSTSSLGDALEYRFDWGDGSFSSWSSTTSNSFVWFSAGTYEVKAQARCATHTTAESSWSAAFTVTITVPPGETVITPDAPSGADAGM